MKAIGLSRLSFRAKLIWLYFLTIFVPLVVTGQTILSVSGSKIIEQTTDITAETSRQTAKNIQTLLNQYMDIVNRLSLDQQLNNYLNPARVYASELESIDAYSLYLKPVTYYDFNFKEPSAKLKIYFTNDTLLQDSVTFVHVEPEVRKLKEFRAALTQNGELAWGTDGERIFVSRAMYNNEHQLSAVVSVWIPENRLYSLIGEGDSKDKKLFIADGEGMVISSNIRELIGTSIVTKPFYKPDAREPFDVVDDEANQTFKVVQESVGGTWNEPDWHLFTLIPLDKLINDERRIRRVGLGVSSLGLMLSCGLFLLVLGRMTSRIKSLVRKMRNVSVGDLTVLKDRGPQDELGLLIGSFNTMISRLQQSIYDNYEANLKLKDITIKKQEAELYALQNQIHPHFLFNTLESIRMGLHNKGDRETEIIVLTLSRLFRHLLNWQGEFISLKEEMELVSRYLTLQKYRFQERIEYEIRLPEEWEECYLPKLTIQPLVENAVKHGIESLMADGLISVHVTSEKQDSLTIRVTDNGVGISPEQLVQIQRELNSADIKKHGSIGLKNVNDRIHLHFGHAYGVSIESTPNEGTTVVVILPKRNGKPMPVEEEEE